MSFQMIVLVNVEHYNISKIRTKDRPIILFWKKHFI